MSDATESALEKLARGASLPDVLTQLVLTYEARFAGMRGSVLLLDPTGRHLRHGAAPNLPKEYCQAIDGVEIGPSVGSCGTAAFTGKPSIASDIANDPLWQDFRALALACKLHACWSMPIVGTSGRVLGTFAFYYDAPRPALPADLDEIERGALLASIAIEHEAVKVALRESEQRYRTLVESAPEATSVHRHGKLLYVNRAMVELLGATSAQDLAGKDLLDFAHPDARSALLAHMNEKADEGGTVPALEVVLLKRDGTAMDVAVQGRSIVYDGAPAILDSMHDISERERADAALRESEARTRFIVQAANVGLWDWDLRTNDAYLSPEWKRQLGYADHEVTNHFVEFEGRLHPDDRAATLAAVADFRDGRRATYESEFRMRHRDGSWRWILARADVTRDADGRPLRMMGSHIDITERKQAEVALRTSERELREAERVAHVGHWAWNTQSGKVSWSDEMKRIWKLDPAVVGDDLDDVIARTIHPDDREKVLTANQAFLVEQRSGALEYRIVLPDATVRTVLAVPGRAVTDASGKVVELTGTVQDITEQKLTEAALRESEERFRNAFEHSAIGMALISRTGRWQRVNAKICSMLGYSEGELSALTFQDLTHPDDLDRDIEQVRQVLAGKIDAYTMEKRYLHKDGRIVWGLLAVASIRTSAGEFSNFVFQVVDITEQKAAEQAVRWNRSLLQLMSESSPFGFLVVDNRNDAILHFNQRFCDLWGISHLADRMRRGELKNGDIIPDCLPVLADVEAFAASCAPLRDEANRVVVEDEIPFTGGRTVRRFSAQIRGSDDGYFGRFYIFEDISERMRSEDQNARLEVQLHHAQKMDSVGRLAGGVAHDFNNMLGVILGHTEMALEQVDPASSLKDDLEEVRKAAMRSAALTRQLLAFARKQATAPVVLDINDRVDGILAMLRRLLGENIQLAWQPGADVWPVYIDASQLDQILTNLCVNARDAISTFGALTVETANVTVGAKHGESAPGSVPGDYVRLTVRDDGCGMDRETRPHLFEPFFTTKAVGEGTGLGLAIVHGIVTQNKGSIDVESEPGHGTTFTILLPRHHGIAGPAAERRAATIPPGHETILVVEDEPGILSVTRRILERMGYAVLTAGTPSEAMRQAEQHGREIHLVLSDVVMPEMSGPDLARNLMSRHPHLKLVFMSGFPANVSAQRGLLEDSNFLQKPFSKADLAAKIREVLDDRPKPS